MKSSTLLPLPHSVMVMPQPHNITLCLTHVYLVGAYLAIVVNKASLA